jgi:hypothetical protein
MHSYFEKFANPESTSLSPKHQKYPAPVAGDVFGKSSD